MSRPRSLYCHSDTGPTGPTALILRDWIRSRGVMCTSCCSFLPVIRSSRLPASCGVSLDVRLLRTLGDKRVAPYTTVELVVLCHPLWLGLPTAAGPRALVGAGLEARPPSAGLRPCRHKNTLLNSEQILLRNKFSNLLPVRDISSILTS